MYDNEDFFDIFSPVLFGDPVAYRAYQEQQQFDFEKKE